MQKKIVTFLFTILCFSYSVIAQSPLINKESARKFVQKFYDQYNDLYNTGELLKSPKKSAYQTTDIVELDKFPELFEKNLRKAIKADRYAQSKVDGEIIGFDFDPFLNAQDDGFTYITNKVVQKGSNFYVEIHSGLKGKTKASILQSKIVVIAEITSLKGKWMFTNFFYPSSKNQTVNLIKILQDLHKDRNRGG